jgi:hypothetical protein
MQAANWTLAPSRSRRFANLNVSRENQCNSSACGRPRKEPGGDAAGTLCRFSSPALREAAVLVRPERLLAGYVQLIRARTQPARNLRRDQ